MSPNVVPSRTSNETSCSAHSSSARDRAVRTRCLSDDGFCLNSRNRLLTASISIASTVDARAFSLVIGAVRVASRLSHPMTRGLTVSEDDAARTHDHVIVNRSSWDDDAPNWVERGRTSWASEPRWGIWGVPESQLGLLPDHLAGLDAVEIGCGTGYVSAWLARRGARPVALDNLTHGDMIRLLRSNGLEIEDLLEVRAPDEWAPMNNADVSWEWARRWPSVEAWKARKVRSAG